MVTKRAEAYKLRIQGRSYNEINAELGVPKSTLSNWFKDIVLSVAARQRLKSRVSAGTLRGLVKRNIQQTRNADKRARSIREEAQREIEHMSLHDIKMIGTALYWAEGYKRLKVRDGKERMFHAISFVNADGDMVRIFLRFLQEVLEVPEEKLRLTMRLYPHINESDASAYWERITGLNKSHFNKTSCPVSNTSKKIRPHNRLPWGTLQISVSDTAKFHRILGWIEGVKAKL